MAYSYENFTLCNVLQPLNLEKKYNFWSTPKQSYLLDEETKRTQNVIEKYDIKIGQELTMIFLKMDVLQLTDVFENFVEKSTRMYSNNSSYSYSAPRYSWKAGVTMTKIKLDFIKDKHLLLEKNISGGIPSVMGHRYLESNENTKLLYLDANNLY